VVIGHVAITAGPGKTHSESIGSRTPLGYNTPLATLVITRRYDT
jgi:hypothetical protein